ncbi:MAG: Hsp20/alpha crystallin family protein, partial [Bdellovibrionales bacterium]|nr:Hsp20/alpha crystallin family protein [Bdellovibrionales bacterium]
SYLVEVQLAGAELDEIQVSLDQDLLVITYERKRDRQEGPAKGVLQHEWFLESAKRTLQLPHADRDSEPQARFTGGVLTIEVFKRPENKSRRVSIR